MLTTPVNIHPGEHWESTREKHNRLRVVVVSITDHSVNIRVVRGGANQNNRKVRGQKWHIGKEEFIAHYAKVQPVESNGVKPTYQVPPSISITQLLNQIQEGSKPNTMSESATIEESPNSQEVYDFKIDELLERTVRALKRWNKSVKPYVLNQNFKQLNAQRTRQLIDRGVKLGVLDTWAVGSRSNRPGQTVQFVGLPGSKPDETMPIMTEKVEPMPQSKRDHFATLVRATIQRQYDALGPETREEIAKLSAGGEPTQEIQKAYSIMGAVVGMIKREFNIGQPWKARQPANYVRKPRSSRVVKTKDTVLPSVVVNNVTGLDQKPVTNSHKKEAQQTFNIVVSVLVPSEKTITVVADSMEDALYKARNSQTTGPDTAKAIIEILSVSKA